MVMKGKVWYNKEQEKELAYLPIFNEYQSLKV